MSPTLPSLALLLLATAAAPALRAQDRAPDAIEPPAPSAPAHDEPAPRPHVILILADDLGPGDISGLNPDGRIATPHIDALIDAGLSLDDAHSPSAVCTPTRYGLLTGRYAWRSQLTSWVLDGESPNLINPARLTVADLLRDAGYRTAALGKWHLGLSAEAPIDWTAPLVPGPLQHGFDSFLGIPASLDMPPYVWVLDERLVQPASDHVEASAHRRQQGGGFWRAGARSPDFRHAEVLPRLAASAVERIERSAREEPERPLFLYLALSAPHTPWVPGVAFGDASDAGFYGDFVAQVDDVVGQVSDALARTGMADDTLLIVTSDNGAHWPVSDVEAWQHDSHLGRRGQKADIWEAGHRVPFVLRWPGVIPPGAQRDGLFSLTDVLPSLAGMARLELPEDAAEDGIDQWPLLSGQAAARREEMVQHSGDGMFALRMGRWKLIEGLGSGGFTSPRRQQPEAGGPAGQLYDLERDPAERDNRWDAEPEVVERLSARLAQLREQGQSR